MTLQSINPATEEQIATYEADTQEQARQKVAAARTAFHDWRRTSFNERAQLLVRCAEVMEARQDEIARLITLEMGKPISESLGEVKKSAWACRFYAEEGAKMLAPQSVATDASVSGIRFDPLGVVLGIM